MELDAEKSEGDISELWDCFEGSKEELGFSGTILGSNYIANKEDKNTDIVAFDKSSVHDIIAMGFTKEQAMESLSQCQGKVADAVSFLCETKIVK